MLNSNWKRLGLLLAFGSLWLGLSAFEVPYFATNGSSHLSSDTTTSRWNSAAIAAQSVKFFEIQLKINSTQTIELENGQRAILPKGTKVAVSIPERLLGKERDPSKVNLARILDTIRNATNNNGINDVAIIESTNRSLVGEGGKINLSKLNERRNQLTLESVEEEAYETGLDEMNAGVCVDCESNTSDGSLIEVLRRITDPNYKRSGKSSNLLTSTQGMVDAYESSPEVQKLLTTLEKGYTSRRGKRSIRVRDGVESRSIGACWNGVKTALLKGDMVPNYMTGNAASRAGSQLKSQGFVNLLDTDYKENITTPYDAPIGSVLVYEGDAKTRARRDKNFQFGHIEIRTKKGFISDYFSPKSRTGDALAARGRKLIGVYIKPNNNIGTLALHEAGTGDKK